MRRSAPSSRALDRAGHDVVAAGSLAEMRRALDRGLPDVLVTDVVLPDGNGLDAVAGFVRDHPRLPVLVLSAQHPLTTAVRATEVGAYDYLPKPFDLDALMREVAGALEREGGVPVAPVGEADDACPCMGRAPR